MPATRRLPPPAIAAAGTVVALLLAWRILEAGMPALLDATVAADPWLEEVTREPLAPAPDLALREQIARQPNDAASFLALARLLDREGRDREARAAIDEALRMDPLQPDALADAARSDLRAGRVDAALDTLRRRIEAAPERADEVWPTLLAELASGRGTAYLARLGAVDPPWFARFLRHACERAGASAGVLQLYAARADAARLSDAERACVLERLQRDARWAEARALWLRGLPAAQRPYASTLFDGGFALPPSNLGFGWIVAAQDGLGVETVAGAGAQGAPALHVSYADARYAGPAVQQTLMLAPGRHAFTGSARAQAFDSWLGLQWALRCADAPAAPPRLLARTDALAGTTEWRSFRREFSVPGDCPVQRLQLELANPQRDATTPGDVVVRLRGSLWYAGFAIGAVDAPARGDR